MGPTTTAAANPLANRVVPDTDVLVGLALVAGPWVGAARVESFVATGPGSGGVSRFRMAARKVLLRGRRPAQPG
jgi:hypothetical protein